MIEFSRPTPYARKQSGRIERITDFPPELPAGPYGAAMLILRWVDFNSGRAIVVGSPTVWFTGDQRNGYEPAASEY
jgi:hypothetical protein